MSVDSTYHSRRHATMKAFTVPGRVLTDLDAWMLIFIKMIWIESEVKEEFTKRSLKPSQ